MNITIAINQRELYRYTANSCFYLILFVIIIQIFGVLPAGAQDKKATPIRQDTLSIRFRLDSVRIDMNYANNRWAWQRFEESFFDHYDEVAPHTLRLDIYSGASPEGAADHNYWLGEQRGLAIRRLVRQRLGSRVGSIVVHNEGERWDGFYDLVAMSNEPWRDEVLRIIDMNVTPVRNERDKREVLLRKLYGGTVWPILLERYLAPLRSGATAILSYQHDRDTIFVRDTVLVLPAPGPDTEPGTAGYARITRHRVDSLSRLDSLYLDRLHYPAWAVKTNLLLWGVVAPNVQVEVPLGKRNKWSLEVEYFHPWFVWNRNAHASECINLGVEVRRWLGRRKYHRWLDGWHVGAAIAAGYYDWEWKKSYGYQGEHINAYINVGYQHRWGKHWAVDGGLGIGAFMTKYRHYLGSSTFPEDHEEEWDRHLMWQHTKHYIWPGACHANITLAYMFNAWPFRTKAKRLDEDDWL